LYSFEWVIGLSLGAMLLAALARRFGVPYPTFLALGGVALAFVPDSPKWVLEPDLALALFVAPVLLDAAFDTSLRDLRDNWIPVTTLVVAAVAVTTGTVAVVVRWMIPDVPWSAAIALGAIVAPPDAAAATAVLRSVKLPYRALKILEGESLLNDVTALLIYRVAAGVAMASSLSVSHIAPALVWAVVGSFIVGYSFARFSMLFTSRITDAPSAIIMQFTGTFLMWIIAEKLETSPILTIVIYAVTLARNVPAHTPARLRVPSYAVWETVVFLLNVGAFVLIGMQLSPIWSNLAADIRSHYVIVAGATLATVILTRLVWVMSYITVLKLFVSWLGFKPRHITNTPPTMRGGLLISWCGMRGIVTLAAAFALPEGFPYRDLILLTAFAVVLGTLVIQGVTLRPLLRWLALDDGDPLAQEINWARRAAFHAALEAIDGNESTEAKMLRLEYQQMLDRVEKDHDGASSELPADPLRRHAIDAARRVLFEMRQSGQIGDDAFHKLEEEFDWAELAAG
jgi:CPA1 family monovalent cation:H+ antiporter